ncbi:glycosyltransferase involved in cell wall biosynthesis [Dietzia kunjamensis]|uniref:glycosyltransferase n=2 Tax=Dietzia kunjamensis TaxID=322509 RepID=UPI000E7638EB|nr:glycosyltransferase [Dietzia kunjamensis]RKE59496.1 glycosyltransferase involved in cell wall biosynthesis [Dietzia kunjamensis]
MTPTRIDYLVSRFPRTSETFIVREIDALASAGDGAGAGAGASPSASAGAPIGTIRSLFASPDTTVHPVAARWSGRAWRPGARDVAAGLGWALRHRPGPLARLLGAVAVDFRRSPAMLLRALATLLVATAHARDLSRTSGVHVHSHYATFPLLAAWACHRLTGVTYSVTTHAHDIYVDTSGLARRCAEAQFVVAISRHNVNLLRGLLGPAAPIELVHCGIDTAAYECRPRRLPETGPIHALCVASLQEYKGHRHLLEAMAVTGPATARLELDLIGDGPLRGELSALAGELGIADRVRFRGSCPESEVAAALAAADLFVLPSVVAADGQMEGLPVALMESLASGVPTVSTRLSGIGEIVMDGHTGLLCEPGDPADLARAVEQLATDPEATLRMSRAGRELVEEQFELRRSAAALLGLLDRVDPPAAAPAGPAPTDPGPAADVFPPRDAQWRRPRAWVIYLLALAGHYLGLDELVRRRQGPGLVVLMFHRFSDAPDPHPITVTPRTFRRMAAWCRDRELLVDLASGLRALDEGRAGTRYAITVDDGYHDNLQALAALGAPVPATLYVTTGHIGGATLWPYALSDAIAHSPHDSVVVELLGPDAVRLDSPAARQQALEELVAVLKSVPFARFDSALAEVLATLGADVPARAGDMLSWDDVRRLHRWGVEIGAHTVHHPILANADDATAEAEIVGSRDRIAAELSGRPWHFAYPNGGPTDFDGRDVATVVAAGFSSAVTTIEGINRPDTDRFRLLRFNVHEDRFLAPTGLQSRALFFSSTSGLVWWVRSRGGR